MNKLCFWESLKNLDMLWSLPNQTEAVPPYHTDVPESVRLYSRDQETWRVITTTENKGVELVWQYISQVSEGIVCLLVAHTQIYHYLYTRSMQNMFGTSAARWQYSEDHSAWCLLTDSYLTSVTPSETNVVY